MGRRGRPFFGKGGVDDGFEEAGTLRKRGASAGSSVGSTQRGSPRSARPPLFRTSWLAHLGEETKQGCRERFKSGKPRRASGVPTWQRVDDTTDSPTDQGLEAAHLCMRTARGHAVTVTWRRLSVEGNALKGPAPWDRERSVAGMRARARKPGEPHGRQGGAKNSRCLRWRNPSRW